MHNSSLIMYLLVFKEHPHVLRSHPTSQSLPGHSVCMILLLCHMRVGSPGTCSQSIFNLRHEWEQGSTEGSVTYTESSLWCGKCSLYSISFSMYQNSYLPPPTSTPSTMLRLFRDPAMILFSFSIIFQAYLAINSHYFP